MPLRRSSRHDSRRDARYSQYQRHPSQRYTRRPAGYILWIILALLAGFGLGVVFSQWILAPSTTFVPATIDREPTSDYSQSVPTPTAHLNPPTSTHFLTPTATESVRKTNQPEETSAHLLPDNHQALQRLMLDLINADRADGGLDPVEWDDFAAQVAQVHAEDMAINGYMSHWNLSGEGPDIRYGRAGGTEAVQENVYMYWYRYEDGSPAPIKDWESVIREAQDSLMNSPGHRANIMAPEHTHVGIGIAYNAETGDVRIAQEFINRYIVMKAPPKSVRIGDVIKIKGQVLPGASNPLINLAYEPFPEPMTIAEVESLNTYQSPADFYEADAPQVDATGTFSTKIALNYEDVPGVYHIRIWVDVENASVQAIDAVVDVIE